MKFGTREDGSTICISSFEDKAESGALESRSREQIGLAPFQLAKEMKGYSTHAIVLGYVAHCFVHCLTPTFETTTVVKDFLEWLRPPPRLGAGDL
jgi:hypothetical protein